MSSCFRCQTVLEVVHPISRSAECYKCKTDIRCCGNCEFYDPKVYNECRETQASRILEKDRSNLCDFFKLRTTATSVQSESEKAKAAAEALFRNFKKS